MFSDPEDAAKMSAEHYEKVKKEGDVIVSDRTTVPEVQQTSVQNE